MLTYYHLLKSFLPLTTQGISSLFCSTQPPPIAAVPGPHRHSSPFTRIVYSRFRSTFATTTNCYILHHHQPIWIEILHATRINSTRTHTCSHRKCEVKYAIWDGRRCCIQQYIVYGLNICIIHCTKLWMLLGMDMNSFVSIIRLYAPVAIHTSIWCINAYTVKSGAGFNWGFGVYATHVYCAAQEKLTLINGHSLFSYIMQYRQKLPAHSSRDIFLCHPPISFQFTFLP